MENLTQGPYLLCCVLLYATFQCSFVEGYIWTYAVSQPNAEGAYEQQALYPTYLRERPTRSDAELTRLDNKTKRHSKVSAYPAIAFKYKG